MLTFLYAILIGIISLIAFLALYILSIFIINLKYLEKDNNRYIGNKTD
jgi:hypothetical protein